MRVPVIASTQLSMTPMGALIKRIGPMFEISTPSLRAVCRNLVFHFHCSLRQVLKRVNKVPNFISFFWQATRKSGPHLGIVHHAFRLRTTCCINLLCMASWPHRRDTQQAKIHYAPHIATSNNIPVNQLNSPRATCVSRQLRKDYQYMGAKKVYDIFTSSRHGFAHGSPNQKIF